MRKSICYSAAVISLLFGSAVGWPQVRQTTSPQPTPAETISLTEAEIIVYLLPQAREVRKERGQVSWEVEAGPSQNTEDFYTFWVVGSKRQGEGSNTIGHFSVNTHTADVWNTALDKLISDEELQGVQKILRQGHHIGSQILDQYHDMKPLP